MQWIFQFGSVTKLCLTLCDPMDCSTPGFPVHHQLPELAQTHIHWVHDAIQPCHLLSSPSPSTFNHSQHQDLFQWIISSHQVAKYWSFSFSISPSNEYQYWFPLELTGLISLPSQGLSRVFSSPIVQKHQFFCYSAFFTIQLSHPYKTTGYLSLGLTITGASQGDLFHSGCVYLEIRNP